MTRTPTGKALAYRMKATAELESYTGGCHAIPGGFVCQDPEYGYMMSGLELCRERERVHLDAEFEMGHRVGAFMEVADDAELAFHHAGPWMRDGSYALASLRDCPGRETP